MISAAGSRQVSPDPGVLHDGRGSTVPRLLLGSRLRQLREGRAITQQAAGEAIRGSAAKISRLEAGRAPFKQRDLVDLLVLYGVTDRAQQEWYLALAAQAKAPGWWRPFSDLVPGWFEAYLGLEEAATVIRGYEVQFMPALLQTRAYAEAVTRLGHRLADTGQISRRVELRMGRQARLTAPDAPKVWMVLDEAVLRRPIGDRAVLRLQLEHLRELCTLPRIAVQVLPFARSGYAGTGGPFTILRFREPELPDVVYLEQLSSATYLDRAEDVDQYAAVMNQLAVEALPAERTPQILSQAIEEI